MTLTWEDGASGYHDFGAVACEVADLFSWMTRPF